MANVFVIGLDRFNLETARELRESGRYVLHPLLPLAKVNRAESYDYDGLLREADEQLRAFEGTVDAIVTWWDFPGTTLVPVLAELWDLPGPSLRSVVTLEHKYWSRLVQRLVVPEHVPPFVAFDPFADAALDTVRDAEIDFPLWVKPVRSVGSYLGFRVEDEGDFARAMTAIRDQIWHYGDPFQQAMAQLADLPHEIDVVGARSCLAEGIISGRQCTVEGFVSHGTVQIYGVVDSLRRQGESPFAAYVYPSSLPQPVLRRMGDIAEQVVVAAGLDHSCFNMEFFYDEAGGKIWLLEVNVRLSQSHCDLFAKVDGASSQRVLFDVAQGRAPRMPHRRGEYAVACKHFIRVSRDGTVRRVPSPGDLAVVSERFPGVRIALSVAAGTRLSELPIQDSYSYELGRVFIGAPDHASLEARRQEIERMLPFEIEPSGAGS